MFWVFSSQRFGTNDNIVSGTAVNYFSAASLGSIGRIEMYYTITSVITTTDATTITINSAVQVETLLMITDMQ